MLQGERYYKTEPFRADGDLTGKEGCFVKHGANDEDAAICSVGGEFSLGLLIAGAADNKAVSVLREGVGMAKVANAAYALGAELAVAADGTLVAAAAGNLVVARSMEKRTVASAEDLQVQVHVPFYKHA